MRLHCETFGRGPDLVLLHGWGMNGSVWASFGQDLATQFRVHVLELPGHGASKFDPRAAAFEQWVDECLDALPMSAIWVGWSLGGLIALGAALTAHQRVSQLVIIAGSPCFVQDVNWPYAMNRETFRSFGAKLQAGTEDALGYFLQLQVLGGATARHNLRQLRGHLTARPLPQSAALVNSLALLGETDLRPQLGNLSVPSFWLFGEHDGLVPGALAATIQDQVPQAKTRVIKGAAHVPFLSHPRECRQALAAFLEEVA